MRMPDFEVDARSYGLSVHWEDAERRYHFWLDDNGAIKGDTLHSNLKAKPQKYGDHGHRKMSLVAKRWAPIVGAMMERIETEGLVAKARERAAAEEAAVAAKRIDDANDERLARLANALGRLPDEAAEVIRNLPKDVRAAFVAALE